MSTENPGPAPSAHEAPAATPPANPDAVGELAALREELAALRAEIAAQATVKPEAPAAPIVPATDTPPPAITPKAPDISGLPVHARMAAGYSK